MERHEPITALRTHKVTNQPPPLADVNLYEPDAVLSDALAREGACWAEDRVRAFGAQMRSAYIRQPSKRSQLPPRMPRTSSAPKPRSKKPWVRLAMSLMLSSPVG